MGKIESLTPDQERLRQEWHRRWFAVGSCCEPADRPRAETAITAMYAEIGEAAPRFIWTQSPATACLAIWALRRIAQDDNLESSLRDSLGSNLRDSLESSLESSLRDSLRGSLGSSLWDSLRSSWWGQHEASWIAFYDFCRQIGVVYEERRARHLGLWSEVAQSCGWWWPFRGLCIVADRPELVRWEADRERPRLHRADGPSLRFRDGWEIYSWRGLRVPEKLIREPIPIADIHAEQNQELRRAMIEIVGWERYLREAGARQVHSDDTGELLEVAGLGDGDAVARFIHVRCPSTGREYTLRVPPQTETARAGVAWTFGVEADAYQPAQET